MKKLLFILCTTTVCMGAISCIDKGGGSGPGTGNGTGIAGRWIQEAFSEDSYFCRILIFEKDGTHIDKIQLNNGWEEDHGRYEYKEESSVLSVWYEREPTVCHTYSVRIAGNTLSCMDSSGRVETYSRMK